MTKQRKPVVWGSSEGVYGELARELYHVQVFIVGLLVVIIGMAIAFWLSAPRGL